MRCHTVTLSAILVAAGIAFPGPTYVAAQPTGPAAGQGTSVSPTVAGPDQAKGLGCNTIQKPLTAGGASIVQATGESLQHKNWQPRGGDIQFTVKSFAPVPPNASVYVCFRWKAPDSKQDYIANRPARLDMDADGKQLKVTTTVPLDLGIMPAGIEFALPLVPLADVRIMAIDNTKKEVAADVTTTIGITYPTIAALFAILTIVLGFVTLYAVTAWRIQHAGILKANWFLRIIATPGGFASLSQLQILLWTFVVAASAVYVMCVSGQLVEITNGTLILLGIAGAAGLAAKTHSEAQTAAAQVTAKTAAANAQTATAAAAAVAPAPTDLAAAAAEKTVAEQAAAKATRLAEAAKSRAAAWTNPPATQVPKWSDLVINEATNDDGTVTREVDVTRFQMLMFTVITATFVLLNVITTYVIPEISTGFLTLMGISNGLYVGSKITQRS